MLRLKLLCWLMLIFSSWFDATSAWGKTSCNSLTSGDLKKLSLDGQKTVVRINASGTLAAVLYGSKLREEGFTGRALKVWALSNSDQLGKLIYSDSGNNCFNANICWVGNNLLYSALRGISSDRYEQQMIADPLQALKYVHSYVWSSINLERRDFAPKVAALCLPIEGKNQVLVINPLDELLRQLRLQRNSQSGFSLKSQQFVIYSVPDGKVIQRTTVPVWWATSARESRFIPICVSRDGQYLFGTAYTNKPWNKQAKELISYDFLVCVNLRSGTVNQLTSSDAPDKLQILQRRFYAPGLPMQYGDNGVVCSLDAIIRNLRYRFQYYNARGLVKETRLTDRIVRRNAIPKNGLPLAWTKRGAAIVEVGKDVWLFQADLAVGRVLATNIQITDVVEQIGLDKILVQVQQVNDNSAKSGETGVPSSSSKRFWAILSTPTPLKAASP